MGWEEVEVMAWEEVLGWVVAMAWEEVDMEWEDHLQGESEAPVPEAWRLVLETGSAWNARMSTSRGATSATSVKSQKETQWPSSRALGPLEGGATGAREGALEVHQRRGPEIGIVQSRFSTFQSFCQFGFQVRQLELLKQDQMQWNSHQRRRE